MIRGTISYERIFVDYKIENLTVKHLGKIFALDKATFSNPTSIAILKREFELPMAHILGIRLGEKILGFVNYWLVGNEVHIMNLVIDSKYRRKKMATQLFCQMMRETKDQESYHLELRESNHIARSFYEKFGFKICGKRPKYYGDNGETALLMSMKRN